MNQGADEFCAQVRPCCTCEEWHRSLKSPLINFEAPTYPNILPLPCPLDPTLLGHYVSLVRSHLSFIELPILCLSSCVLPDFKFHLLHDGPHAHGLLSVAGDLGLFCPQATVSTTFGISFSALRVVGRGRNPSSAQMRPL